MKLIKEKIYNQILQNPNSYNIEQLAKIFKMTNTKEFVKINKYLNQLEEDMLIEKSADNTFKAIDLAKFKSGVIAINTKGVGFVDIPEQDSIRILPKDIKDAMHNDEILYDTYVENKVTLGRVVKVVKHATNTIVGTFDKYKNVVNFTPDSNRIINKVKVINANEYTIVSGLKAICKIVQYGPTIKVMVQAILGHKDDPGVDIESVLLANGIKTAFDYETLKQANSISQVVEESDLKGRKDLRNLMTVTIDGDDSKDFDDAISLTKYPDHYNLLVHIADVSYYVIEDSKLDQEAHLRGTSTYVVNRVVPMLPHVLSNGICSLNPNVDRLTLTCDMDLDLTGKVIKYDVYPSVICSNYRMTYSDVNKIIKGDIALQTKYGKDYLQFFDMLELSKLIRRNRFASGSIDFEKTESIIIVDKNGVVQDIKLRERLEAEKLIEDFMVLANECVASLTKKLKIPSLYRVHERPNEQKVERFMQLSSYIGYKFNKPAAAVTAQDFQKCLAHFKDREEYPVISTMMLRSMSKARYDANCLGHFGLGSEEYLHFTSPIRRYPDLIVHRYLRKYYFNKKKMPVLQADLDKVAQFAEDTSICERKAVDSERAVTDMKKAEYMQSHLGEKFYGVISSITNFGFFVELENTIEGLVRLNELKDDYYIFDQEHLCLVGQNSHRRYTLGQKVRVQCARADKETKSVDFILKQPKKRKNNKRNSKKRWI